MTLKSFCVFNNKKRMKAFMILDHFDDMINPKHNSFKKTVASIVIYTENEQTNEWFYNPFSISFKASLSISSALKSTVFDFLVDFDLE